MDTVKRVRDFVSGKLKEKGIDELQLSEKSGLSIDAINCLLLSDSERRQMFNMIADVFEIDRNELLYEAGLLDEDLDKYAKDPDSGLKLVKTLVEADLTDDQLRELIEMIKKEPVNENNIS